MSNRFFDQAVRAAMTTRPMNLLSGAIKAVLVDLAEYTPDFASHDFLSDVPGGALLGAPFTLTGKSLTGRVFDAADVTDFDLGVDLAPGTAAILVFEDTGDATTSPLLLYIDTVTGGAITVPDGASVLNVSWSNGASKIAAL